MIYSLKLIQVPTCQPLLLVQMLIPLIGVCFTNSVLNSQESVLDTAAIEFFEKSVRPLLVAHCYECHSGQERQGGLQLDFREAVLKGGDSGPAILPGDPEKSLLIQAVHYKNPDMQMPPKGALSSTEIANLERWISMGAPDPRSKQNDPTAPSPSGMTVDAGREFWSLHPIAAVPIPSVKNTEWVATPVDAFLLANLEANRLHPASKTDRTSLIRRVTLDLTGLPPTPEELEAFVSDDSANAYDSVIDRLLGSPQYGVRWGRHWLDVARYADSNGLDENIAFGNAWRYRDYVIESFNSDKPIDAFIVEQLAGDLIPNSDRESKTGTGFLVLGAKVLAEPDREKLIMDTVDEQLDTIGKAFLGMTFGCVRCHDHKFDPILQGDYYALAAILKSTQTFGPTNTGAIKHWNEISFASTAEKESLKGVNAEIAQHQAAHSKAKSAAFTKLRTQTRSMATEYLMAAIRITPEMSLHEVAAIAEPLGLHARVLFHCRRFLAFNPDHPLFTKWHELASVGDSSGVDDHYRNLFRRAEAALDDAKQKDPKVSNLSDPVLESARSALYDLTGFLAVPPKPEFAFDEVTLREIHTLATKARLVESFALDETAVMGVVDHEVLPGLPIHIRGNHRNLGKTVTRNFPEVMRAANESPILPRKQSGRLELARWITSPNHPLTSRVFVNRLWRWHFGTGIVATTENFGALGDRPSHPALLDFLARSFIESGWSTKELHRMILRSNTYQMSTRHPNHADASLADPENRWLWRFPQQRMDAEQIRDSLLAVSGKLDMAIGGKSIPLRNRQFVFDHTSIDNTRYESCKRAAFLPVVRNNLYTLFEQFDFPDPTMPTGSRNTTTVAPQALLMMNSDLVMNAAKQLGASIMANSTDNTLRIENLYRIVLGRKPLSSEVSRAIAFLEDGVLANSIGDEQNRWILLCHSLLLCNESIFIN